MRRDLLVLMFSVILLLPAVPVMAAPYQYSNITISSENTWVVQGPLDEAVLIHTLTMTDLLPAFNDPTITMGLTMMAIWTQQGNVPIWPIAYLAGGSFILDFQTMYPGSWAFFVYTSATSTLSLSERINAIQNFAQTHFGFQFDVIESYSVSGLTYIAMRVPQDASITNYINALTNINGSVFTHLYSSALNNATYKHIAYFYSPGHSSLYAMFDFKTSQTQNGDNYQINLSNLYDVTSLKLNCSYTMTTYIPYANITAYSGATTINRWPFASIILTGNSGDTLNVSNITVTYNYKLKAPSLMVYSTLENYSISNSGSTKLIVHVKNIGNAPAYNLQFVQMLPSQFGGVPVTNNSIAKLDVGAWVNYTVPLVSTGSVNDLVSIDPGVVIYNVGNPLIATFASWSQTITIGVGTVNKPIINLYVTTNTAHLMQGNMINYTIHVSNYGSAPGNISLNLLQALEWFGALQNNANFTMSETINPNTTISFEMQVKATVPFVWLWSAYATFDFFDINIEGVDSFSLNAFPIFVEVNPSFGYGLPEFKVERVVSGNTVNVTVTNVGDAVAVSVYAYDLIPINATVVSGNYDDIYTDPQSGQKYVYAHAEFLAPGESFSFTYTLSYSSLALSSNFIYSGDDVSVTKTKFTFRGQEVETYQQPETQTSSSSSSSSGTSSSTSSGNNSTSGTSPGFQLDSSTLMYIGLGVIALVIIIAIAKKH